MRKTYYAFNESQITTIIRPPALRLLVLLLIMFDTIRRIFEGSRPLDEVMLGIEFLILLFIVVEFVWKVADWWKKRAGTREYEQDMTRKLGLLELEEQEALRLLILKGGQPQVHVAKALSNKIYGVFVRDPLLGWGIGAEHRSYVKHWAEGKSQSK